MYVGLADDAADGKLGIILQHVGCLVPDLLCIVLGQRLGDAEVFVELQVGPVVHGVADGHFQGLCEGKELFIGICGTGHGILRNAVGAHDSPLVVVAEIAAVVVPAAQPDLGDVVVAAVLIDLFGRNMAVVVDDRHIFGICMKETFGRLVIQHEILIHKSSHSK